MGVSGACVRPTLCDPMDYSPQGSSAQGILQARILERVAIPFPDLPDPRIKPTSFASPALAGGFFPASIIREARDERQGTIRGVLWLTFLVRGSG